MIRAVLFDFNGVIVDDEPVHFTLFQKVLAEEGLKLSKEHYYSRYLGMDDHDCFAAASRDQNALLSEAKIADCLERKNRYYQEEMEREPPFVPGVLKLIEGLAKTHFLAVVSGALRREVEWLLKRGGVAGYIQTIVAAEDVAHGKPDPEGYDKGMQILNRDCVASSEMLLPAECLVIEDSIWGIQAATAAGMPAIAVTTSFDEKQLPGAIRYFKDFSEVEADTLIEQMTRTLDTKGEMR